jgi:hypothetical protein
MRPRSIHHSWTSNSSWGSRVGSDVFWGHDGWSLMMNAIMELQAGGGGGRREPWSMDGCWCWRMSVRGWWGWRSVIFCEECLWGNVGFVARPQRWEFWLVPRKNEKIKSHLADTRVSLEHPKSGNSCENVSLLLERQMNSILPKIV